MVVIHWSNSKWFKRRKRSIILKNGYEGEWRNNKREGKGVYYQNREPFTGDKYVLYWKNDKREGKAVYHYYKGNRYEGNFRNDQIEGRGIFYSRNGDKY